MTPPRELRAAVEAENRALLEWILADFTSSRPTAAPTQSPSSPKHWNGWLRPVLLLSLLCLVALEAVDLYSLSDAAALFQTFQAKDFALGLLCPLLLIRITQLFTAPKPRKPRTCRAGATPRRKRTPKPETPGPNLENVSTNESLQPHNSPTTTESPVPPEDQQRQKTKFSRTKPGFQHIKRWMTLIMATALLSPMISLFVQTRALFGRILKRATAVLRSI